MKHQEELQAVAAVVCVFALALLTLLFILKWDDVLYFLQKRCCCCFQRDGAESVTSYSNLNELLFDTDETRGGTLRILRTSDDGDFVVVEKEKVTVDTFFSNVLGGNAAKSKQTRSLSRAQGRAAAEEPLL